MGEYIFREAVPFSESTYILRNHHQQQIWISQDFDQWELNVDNVLMTTKLNTLHGNECHHDSNHCI